MTEFITVWILLQLAILAVLVFLLWSIVKFPADVLRDIRRTVHRLTDVTEASLRVRGGHFGAFSPAEIMTQQAAVEGCRKRHGEFPVRRGLDDVKNLEREIAAGKDLPKIEEEVKKGYDSFLQLEASETVLDAMHLANHDGDHRSETPFWTRNRVHAHAAEYQPHGRRWKDRMSERDHYLHDIHAAHDHIKRKASVN